MKVLVVPHDPSWARLYRLEASRLRAALAPNLTRIHHIGSTSIPGIYAKPIVDLLGEVKDLAKVDQCLESMQRLGYQGLGEFGIPGRRYFRKNDSAGLRTHHLHIFAAESPQVRRHLAFRDFLIQHRDWAQRYSQLKRELAGRFREDMQGYIDGKDPFIKEVDRLAAAQFEKSTASLEGDS